MHAVSVIIPTYNREHRLKQAVQSVFSQRLPPMEIIIVDDGSSDKTRHIVQRLSQCTDIPMTYYFQANKGPAAARNSGIRLAKGEFIAFLDSDDEWHKNKIMLQYQALKDAPPFQISHTKERWLKNGKHLNQKTVHMPRHGDIYDQSLKLCCVGMSTVMARKTMFTKYGVFDESLRCCEDYDLWLRISPFEPFLLIDKQLTIKHGGREDQVSNQFRMGMDRFRIQALANLIDSLPVGIQKRSACSELIRRCTIYSKGCNNHGKETEAAFYTKLGTFFLFDKSTNPNQNDK